MTDNNNLIVYCEYDEGRIADVSLELLTKGRQLASKLGVKLEAIVIGDNLDGIEKQLFPYGVDTVYKVSDKRLYPYTSNPHAAVLINLFREIKPQICLMGATCIGRDLHAGGGVYHLDPRTDAENYLQALPKQLLVIYDQYTDHTSSSFSRIGRLTTM